MEFVNSLKQMAVVQGASKLCTQPGNVCSAWELCGSSLGSFEVVQKPWWSHTVLKLVVEVGYEVSTYPEEFVNSINQITAVRLTPDRGQNLVQDALGPANKYSIP